MSLDLKKTALNALLPVLMMTQAGFSSARSSSVSRSLPVRSVMVTSQPEATQTSKAYAVEQSNPFAAFGSAGHQEQLVQQELAAETLAFLAEQGLLQSAEEIKATESGHNFEGRKEFSSLNGVATFSDLACDATGTEPAYHATPGRFFFNWYAIGQSCLIGDNTQNPKGITTLTGRANCEALHLKCKSFAPANAAPTDISLTANTLNQSASANTVVGTLSSTDANGGDTHTYTLVAGTGSTDNGSFNISSNQLRATNPGAIAAGNRSVRIRTTDNGSGNLTYEEAFTVVVTDNVAPVVSSVAVPANATYSAGQNLDFTVSTSENVTVNTGGGTPRIPLTIGATTRYASYVSGSGSNNLTFRYTVDVADLDTDGIAVGATIDDNGGTLKDVATNDLTLTLNSVASTAGVLVISTPTITSATYDASTGALVVTGTNFAATGGATNDVIANKFTLTAEGGSTYTLTDTANVEITSATSFTLMLSGTDFAAVNLTINKNGTSSTSGTTYNLAGAAGFIAASGATADTTGNGMTVSNTAVPTVTSATYDANTGVLVVTGTNFKSRSGASNDIVANKLTLTGEGGSTWTMTDTADVEVTSGTSFTLTLSATDRTAINLMVNKNGTSATGGTTYNLAAAEDWANGADAAVVVADNTGNGVTASNVAIPAITSATYNASTRALVVTGSGLSGLQGASNDIVANKFTFTGDGAATYSLTDTANVEVTSGTSFTLTLSATDGNAVNLLLNKNGTSSVDATTYNLAAAEDWAAGADAAVVVADLTGNGITTSNAISAPDAPTIGTATAGDGQVSVAFTAPVNDGGESIDSYEVIPNPVVAGGPFTAASSPIVVTGLTNGTAYTFTVTATNAIGTSVASGASALATPKGDQTITFPNPGVQTFGTSPDLGATASASSTLAVSFTSTTTGVCTTTGPGVLTFVSAGSCTIDADQAGNSAWNAAPTVTETFTVNAIAPDAPTIGTATAGNTEATVTFTAPVSTGGAAILAGGYTVTSSPGGLTGTGSSSPVTVTGLTNGVAYTFTVTATNSAGAGVASAASNSVTPAAPQTITFNNPGAQTFGTTPTLSASSSAGGGYVVTFTSSTTGVCTVSGTTLTFVTAGTCTINADQAGDSSFLAASQVSRSFTVNPIAPDAPTIGTATAGDTQASVAFTAPVNFGGAAITSYTVTASPGGLTGTGASSPIVVADLTNGVAYSFTVTATNSAGTGSASATSNMITPAAAQTITFANPGGQTFGTTPTLTATTDATGLTPTFTSSTTGVCTITSGGLLTFVTAGTCTINADQAGNSSYLAATQVSRSFTVSPILPGAPVIGTATAANAAASVSFTAPASSGGVAITGYTVTSNPGAVTATGASSPINVPGLTNGTSYTFTVTATNSVGTSPASAVSNSVTPELPNTAPVISGSPATTVVQGVAYSFVPAAADADEQTLTFSISNQPAWASFSASTGALSGVPGVADVGTVSGIVISVSDGVESASLPAFSITVTAANQSPVISGTPETSVKAGAAYSFTPTASDPDEGAVLTFSISNKPAWASFSTSTGALSGTPAGTDVGVTSGIVISVSDGTASANLPAFSLAVTPGNVAPVATDSAASTDEDSPLSLTLTAEDVDKDQLTYQIVTQPSNGTASLQGNLLIYTPALNFNGTDSISFVAKDAELSSNTATISLTVTAVNDLPVITDDSFELQRTSNNQYQLAVLANDSDVDNDSLTIDGASSSVGTVTFNAQGLTLTAPDLYAGPVTLRYTVSDGKGGRGTANVSLIIGGGEPGNLPVITVPADIRVNATALFTRVPLGTATAVDRNGRKLRVSLINGSLFFAPGEHIVYWQATDADGNTATKAQKVSVDPLISLSKDQLVTEGNEVVVNVILNGPSPQYPVEVPYSVSGSAGANDHTLVSGVAEISSGLSTSIRFNVLEDGIADAPEDIVIRLDSSVNRGSQRSSRIVISEANIAPVVTLAVEQNGLNRLTISEGDGVVTVTAARSDINPQDQLTGSWDFGQLENVSTSQTELSFDPAEQGPGLYQVSYTVTDNGTPNLSTSSRVFIVVRPSLPTLGNNDTDGDLVPDNQEGFADSDGDGIPDYQDAINECNVMPTELLGQTEFVAEGDPGVCLRLGTVAAQTDAGGLQIAKDAIETDTTAVNIGGIFDFIAYGLPEQGKSYSLVIPQRLPVPANAIYRKYNDVSGWKDFVSNEKNSVSSTQGERGFCPPPGDALWSEGLTEGHWCVQVQVEDGGPNDADGIANGAIVDPGGVAVAVSSNRLPVAVADQASTRDNTAVVVNVLANDTDADGDSLTITQAVAGFGTVTILADQKLSYLPNTDFTGMDKVIYSVTDGKGGTASAELLIDVFSNSAPIAVNDVAATNDKTAIVITVLANDTDADGNSLTVTSATAVQGAVSIEAGQRLRYTPKAGFDGVDTISYSISDGAGGTATAQVMVTVTAFKDVVVENKSSGGSMTLWALLLLGTAAVLRRSSAGAAAAVMLLFSPISQSADWYLQGAAGHSSADSKQSSFAATLPAGTTITAFDKSDFSYGVAVGYRLHPAVAIEVGYQDLGDASSQLSGESLTPGQYHELLKTVSPVLVDGVSAAFRFTLWQDDRWRLELPVGVFFWNSEIKSRTNNTELRTESDGNDWLFGLQLQYQLTNEWLLGGGYQQINLAPNDVSSWLLSVRYQF